MIIKCPHCRFKYEDEVKPGIEELSCVCPRCAYPFTVTIGQENITQPTPPPPGGLEGGSPREEKIGDGGASVLPPKGERGGPSIEPEWITRPAQAQSPLQGQGANRTPQNRAAGGFRGSCCLKSLIVLVIVAVGLVLLVRSCYQSFTADDLDHGDYTTAIGASRDDAYANDPHPDKLPKWVQGNWVYNGDNGFQISVKIHGRKISETSGGETSYGTISFDGSIITADFGDGHQMRYKVYKDEKVIDCGGANMKMKKIE
ncbi:MAG: hypothetical protein IJM81_08995 [Prevotella sp.]|nr:hypothetical protein [Prevotella sp.]